MIEETILTEPYMDVLRELLTCGQTIYSWTYSREGDLISTNSPTLALHHIFVRSGCLDYAVGNLEALDAPLHLGTQLSLVWGAVMEQENDRRIHVIGPVLSNDVSLKTIEDAARRLVDDLSWRAGFAELLKSLSVVPNMIFQEYLLMLYYCVNRKKLTISDIQYQQMDVQRRSEGAAGQPPRDRHQTYMAEKALLYCVREGDLNYQPALNRASSLSGGLQVQTQDPINQALLSVASFTSLCVRAAIEGGLSPETAYSVGDGYIQSLLSCKSVSEIGAISHTMYEDFIHRVHKARENTSLSKPIRDCVAYIELHSEEELSLKLLARLCGYTDYYLSRKFKKEVGVSIGDYIDFVRIERAKMLLETTRHDISDIAESLHFCSSTYFSDTFKSIVGMLPSQYRKEVQST